MTRRALLRCCFVLSVALNVFLVLVIHARRRFGGDHLRRESWSTPEASAATASDDTGIARSARAGEVGSPHGTTMVATQTHERSSTKTDDLCPKALQETTQRVLQRVGERPDARTMMLLFTASEADSRLTADIAKVVDATLAEDVRSEGHSVECRRLVCRLKAGFEDEKRCDMAQHRIQAVLGDAFPGSQFAVGPNSNPGGVGTGIRMFELYFRDPRWAGR
jgi:hypothetical protein